MASFRDDHDQFESEDNDQTVFTYWEAVILNFIGGFGVAILCIGLMVLICYLFFGSIYDVIAETIAEHGVLKPLGYFFICQTILYVFLVLISRKSESDV